MSSSRGASAALSRNTKSRLVKLLFGPSYTGHGTEAHRRLDASGYSYKDLKAAYLSRVHDLHPDKSHPERRETAKQEFVALRQAWTDYEAVAKQMKRVGKGDGAQASFTMFGVGCSFADSDREKDLRAAITDQACRGWFSAGELGDGVHEHPIEEVSETTRPANDSLFTDETEESHRWGDKPEVVEENTVQRQASKGSLVDDLLPKFNFRKRA